MSTFLQTPPSLGNQFDADPFFQEYLERTLPEDVRRAIT